MLEQKENVKVFDDHLDAVILSSRGRSLFTYFEFL